MKQVGSFDSFQPSHSLCINNPRRTIILELIISMQQITLNAIVVTTVVRHMNEL